MRNRTRESLPIGLEWVAFQGLLLVSPLFVPELEKTSPLLAIGGVPADVPVVLIAGRHDTKATPEQVGRLHDRVRAHGRLVVFERAGHLRYLQSDPELYRRTLLDFVRSSAPPRAGSAEGHPGGADLPGSARSRNAAASSASSKTSQ